MTGSYDDTTLDAIRRRIAARYPACRGGDGCPEARPESCACLEEAVRAAKSVTAALGPACCVAG